MTVLSKQVAKLDFGCALQKEILLQGRIYISENHICFNANIFGWVTNVSQEGSCYCVQDTNMTLARYCIH